MLGGGGGQQCQPVYPPNDKGRSHKNTLQMVALVHLFIALSLLFLGAQNFFTELLTVMCLFCATLNYNYCCVLIYIIYTGFDWFQNIEPVGLMF